MKRSKYSDEQILAIVKEGEAGRKVADVCRAHGITEQTYYRWKAKYGGMELSEMQRLKQLEDENRRLKHIVAEQTLDIQALNIRNYEKYGFAGFHVGSFNQSGYHADSQYRYNDVASWYDQQSFGIVIGFHPWNATVPVPFAGYVNDNWTWGAVVNLAIDGISDGEIQRNTFGAHQGSRGFSHGAPANCWSADYTAGDFGSASKQGGYINRIFHPC
jgi:putative transposase